MSEPERLPQRFWIAGGEMRRRIPAAASCTCGRTHDLAPAPNAR